MTPHASTLRQVLATIRRDAQWRRRPVKVSVHTNECGLVVEDGFAPQCTCSPRVVLVKS